MVEDKWCRKALLLKQATQDMQNAWYPKKRRSDALLWEKNWNPTGELEMLCAG